MGTITYSIFYPPIDTSTRDIDYNKVVDRANKALFKIFRFNKKLKLLSVSEEPYSGPKCISVVARSGGLRYESAVGSILKVVYQTNKENLL